MLPPERPARIRVAFDDHRLVQMRGCFCSSRWLIR